MQKSTTNLARVTVKWRYLFMAAMLVIGTQAFARVEESIRKAPEFQMWIEAYDRAAQKINSSRYKPQDHYDRFFAIASTAPAFLKAADKRTYAQEAAYHEFLAKFLGGFSHSKSVSRHLVHGPDPVAIMESIVRSTGVLFAEDSHLFARAAHAYSIYAVPHRFPEFLKIIEAVHQDGIIEPALRDSIVEALRAYLDKPCRAADCKSERLEAKIWLGRYGSVSQKLMNCVRALMGVQIRH